MRGKNSPKRRAAVKAIPAPPPVPVQAAEPQRKSKVNYLCAGCNQIHQRKWQAGHPVPKRRVEATCPTTGRVERLHIFERRPITGPWRD